MKTENLKKILAAGMVSCLLTGCGNVIPELTEEEASLMVTEQGMRMSKAACL